MALIACGVLTVSEGDLVLAEPPSKLRDPPDLVSSGKRTMEFERVGQDQLLENVSQPLT